MMTRRRLLHMSALTWTVPVLAACGAGIGQAPQPAKETGTAQKAPAAAKPVTLRFGDLPLIDALPVYVADADGLFTQKGLRVELVPFASAVERDAAFTAGQIDAELNDSISSILLNKDREFSKIIRTIMHTTPERAMFYLLAAKESKIQQPADLKGVEIAISHNTVIEYVLDKLVESAGLKPTDIKKLEVARMPLRVEMLAQNQVAAALLPEPLATLAKASGARLILDDAKLQIGASWLSFRVQVLKDQAAAVRSFLEAYEEAVQRINAQPEKYRALMVERARVPDVIKGTVMIPKYPTASLPTEKELGEAVAWARSRELVTKDIPPAQLIDGSFLPKM